MRLRMQCVRWLWFWAWLVFCIAAGAERQGHADGPSDILLTGTVVDESDRPIAGATVTPISPIRPLDATKTDENGAFQIAFPLIPSGRIIGSFLARGNDGRLGYLRITLDTPEPLTIRIKPARALDVRVVDRDHKPVEGAEVGFLANLASLSDGRTDANGRWRVMVPASLPVKGSNGSSSWCVYALKAKTGFDYAISDRTPGSPEPPVPLPDHLTLTLDGARSPLRVKAVDKDGKPLAGVTIRPWIIAKPGYEAGANLAGAIPTGQMTGRDGVATFDWLPAHSMGSIAIRALSLNFYCPDNAGAVSAKTPEDELTISLFPYERLSGRVMTSDRQPVAAAEVVLEGHGAGLASFRGQTQSDADGRYAINVYSEQAYVIAAFKGEMAAPYRSDMVVRAGKPVEDVDLVLGKATRVRGRVTAGKDQKPLARTRVLAVIDEGAIPNELKRESLRFHFGVGLTLTQSTDRDGQFEFRLGPGDYAIRVQPPEPAPPIEPVKVTIPTEHAPLEIVRDIASKESGSTTGPFRVTVVDDEGRPVAGAVVTGMYAAMSPREWIKRTSKEGTVELRRWMIPMVVHVETFDKDRAGIARIGAETAAVRIVVKPTGSGFGRLVGPEGKPLANRELRYGVKVPRSLDPRGPSSDEWGGTTMTDAEGRFRFARLVVGEPYRLFINHEKESRRSSANGTFTVDGPGTLALGDVTIDLNPPRP